MDISSLREPRSTTALTVTELNGYIKNLFDSDRTLSAVSVKGEISNFVNHRSGHLYFSLKDADGQIRAVMFRSSAMRLKFIPEDGMKVVIRGSVSVYSRDGSYQLYATSMEPDGIGALYLAYEQLKARLADEGLFDEEHKKPIPRIPERVGVITSPTGAAVRDIINVTERRFPQAKLYLYPALVQGEGAEPDLIRALDYFERTRLVDVIIIGRGGGSIEDLWAFNGEALARKIFASSIPIISAVGHETDFTICDFVADMRAPTPSAAAELAVPDMRELLLRIDGNYQRLVTALNTAVERKRERLALISEKSVLEKPTNVLAQKRDELSDIRAVLTTAMRNFMKDKRAALAVEAEKANAMNPLSVLSRGYSITEKNGKPLLGVSELSVDDTVSIKLSDGTVLAKIEQITERKV
ncbi:MAG: exodeoxyribonuclease VII large subunit [Clostridia bacterium]|nr:exodeoxyribonuclease VII large subunit [Clostridia bacterium]